MLGELLLLSTERSNQPAGVGFEEIVVTASRRKQEAVSTEVIPSQIKVSAKVDARWKFSPTAPTK